MGMAPRIFALWNPVIDPPSVGTLDLGKPQGSFGATQLGMCLGSTECFSLPSTTDSGVEALKKKIIRAPSDPVEALYDPVDPSLPRVAELGQPDRVVSLFFVASSVVCNFDRA
ncbi:hypothetical protein Bxe_A2562 [Paraburkholderia xenovorans LB400]|uniref:Uncharacterized protein n=1 Tax=Paraburkholderia xenovorans (strain LB400) TaxID=266265 RepID=Q13ZS2_PARXL|nr:hypothetical protein Bxe_A2562 [Paraburkholderia xenovorans LB400]